MSVLFLQSAILNQQIKITEYTSVVLKFDNSNYISFTATEAGGKRFNGADALMIADRPGNRRSDSNG